MVEFSESAELSWIEVRDFSSSVPNLHAPTSFIATRMSSRCLPSFSKASNAGVFEFKSGMKKFLIKMN